MARFGLESGIEFTKELRSDGCGSMCSSFQFQIRTKVSAVKCNLDFTVRNLFIAANLGNDDIISILCNMKCCVLWPPPGLKTGVENEIFLIGSGFNRPLALRDHVTNASFKQ